MFLEVSGSDALACWQSGLTVLVLDKENGLNYGMEDLLNDERFAFLVDVEKKEAAPDPEEHTDAEFEALFEEVPPEALEEAKAHLTRAQKRHMIETLYAQHPELSVGEIAERVGVSAATVRRHIK